MSKDFVHCCVSWRGTGNHNHNKCARAVGTCARPATRGKHMGTLTTMCSG